MDEVQLGAKRRESVRDVNRVQANGFTQGEQAVVRKDALTLALVGQWQNQHPIQVLQRAKAFEDYLISGLVEGREPSESRAWIGQE